MIFATISGKYQNMEKPPKHQRRLGLARSKEECRNVMQRNQADGFVISLIHAEMALIHEEEKSREGEYNRLRLNSN